MYSVHKAMIHVHVHCKCSGQFLMKRAKSTCMDEGPFITLHAAVIYVMFMYMYMM